MEDITPHKLYVLVADGTDEVQDRLIQENLPVLFKDDSDVIVYKDYVLYYPNKEQENQINRWCVMNLKGAWYVEPLY